MYLVHGVVVASEVPLSGVPLAQNLEPALRVRLAHTSEGCPLSLPESDAWHLAENRPGLSRVKMDGGYVLRYHRLADFFVSPDGREIFYAPRPDTPPEAVRHLLLVKVIPLAIYLKGGQAIHASTVLTSEGAVAFAGPSGWGKSSLAGIFVRAGDSLLSDDCSVLLEEEGQIYVLPAYPELRLWEDSLESLFGPDTPDASPTYFAPKRSLEVRSEAYCMERKPLVKVYFIRNPEDPHGEKGIAIERLSQRDGLMILISSALHLDPRDGSMLNRELQFFQKLVSTVSVRSLAIPRGLRLLPSVREAVLADLTQSGQQSAIGRRPNGADTSKDA